MTQTLKTTALDDNRMRYATIWQWAINDHPKGWASLRFTPRSGYMTWGQFSWINRRF